MNIIEAIRSGRRFRRRTETCWYRLNVDTQEFLVDVEGTPGVASIDITNPESFDSIFLCDDWEVEEETFQISIEALGVLLGEALHYSGVPVLEELDDVLAYMRNKLRVVNHIEGKIIQTVKESR